MRRTSAAVVVSMVLGLGGCAELGGDDGLDESEARGGNGNKKADAAPPPADGAPPAPQADAGPPPDPSECNLLYTGDTWGCAEGEKCTFVVTSHEPLTGYRACTPATTENHGYFYECSFDQNGVDDCSPGFFCHGPNGSTPTCWPYCEAGGACYPGTCWDFGTEIPADMTPDGYGVCI